MKQGRQGSADGDAHGGTGLSRKQFLSRGAVATGAAAGLASGARGFGAVPSAAAAKSSPATPKFGAARLAGKPAAPIAFVNGRIHTMDGSARVVSNVLIEDGRFAQVGRRIAERSDIRVIDLRGRTVVPGLIDSHVHIIASGLRPGYITPLERAFSVADVQAIYRARRPDVPQGQWITTVGGLMPYQLKENRLPTLQELDAAVPDRPVFIFVGFTGPATTNTLGKKFLERKLIPVGNDGLIGGLEILSSGVTAGLTGPSVALMALRILAAMTTPADNERNTLTMLRFAASCGLTTSLDQGASFQSTVPDATVVGGFIYTSPTDSIAYTPANEREVYGPVLSVHRKGKMPVRVRTNFLHGETDPTTPNLRGRLQLTWPFFGDDLLRTGGIGEFTTEGAAGITLPTPEWLAATRLVAEAGWRNENHAVVAPDYQGIIAGWEIINREFPLKDLRWVLAHPFSIERSWALRLKALGGGINLSAAIPNQGVFPGSQFRMLLDTGIPLSICSDGAGSFAGMNPFMCLSYAATGRDVRGKLINDGQQVSRHEAMQLMTRASTWFIGEDDLGSIEVGKHADLVVLDKDYFNPQAVPDDQIKHVRPIMTVVGGDVVYDTGKLRRRAKKRRRPRESVAIG